MKSVGRLPLLFVSTLLTFIVPVHSRAACPPCNGCSSYTITIGEGTQLIGYHLSNPNGNDLQNALCNFLAPLDDAGNNPNNLLNTFWFYGWSLADQAYKVIAYYENDFTVNNVGPGYAGWAVDAQPSAPTTPPVMAVGGGGFIRNTGRAVQVTFYGAPADGFVPVPPHDSWVIASRKIPGPALYQDIFGALPQPGQAAIVQRWNGSGFTIYRYSGYSGSWCPSTPVLGLGEAAFFRVTDDSSSQFGLVSAAPDCTATDNKVVVNFNREVDPVTAAVAGNYSVTGPTSLTVQSATVITPTAGQPPPPPGSQRVLLTLSGNLSAGGVYNVAVSGVKDAYCGEPVPANSAARLLATATPRIVRVEPDCSSGQITVVYDRDMGGSAGTAANYTITGGAAPAVSDAMLRGSPNGNRVNLKINAGLDQNTLYTLHVNNVKSSCDKSLPNNTAIAFTCRSTVQGRKFNDADANGNDNGGTEPGLANWVIRLSSTSLASPLFTVTDAKGNYGFSVPAASYTVNEVQKANWVQTKPAGGAGYNLVDGDIPASGKDFGNHAKANISDLRLDIASFGDAGLVCCAQNLYLLVTYQNIGTTTLDSRHVRLDHAGRMQYLTARGTPQVTLAGTDSASPPTWEKWQLPTLLPGQSGQILVTYYLNPAAPYNPIPPHNCATYGSPLVTAEASAGNPPLPSAKASLKRRVRCSFDPNDKTVSPIGCGPEGYIQRNLPLTYTIQFQNTGTGPAYRVVIRDTLDSDLDVNTVQVIGNSHPFVLQISGQQLVCTFDNINLPESSFDAEGSHGYMKFTVSPLSGLPSGTVITNNAAIYFDLNAPITTTTTTNTITDNPLPVAAFTTPTGGLGVGAAANFTYSGGTPGATYFWDFGGDATPATSTDANPTVTWASSGYKLVTLQVSAGGCDAEPAVALVGVGTPRLDVRREGTDCVLSWHDQNFSLQESGNLVDPDSWIRSTATVTINGNNLEARAPLGSGPVFYRLILE